MASRNESPAKTGLPEKYKMDHKRRGLALIFNQKSFDWKLFLGERRGTDADKASLTERFEELGFDVQSYDDSDHRNMMDKLEEAAKADHTDADCFVCVFLSHGEEGHIYASDKKVDIKEVTALFKGNKHRRSLVGKPKIFIIQACQGKIVDEAVTGMDVDDDAMSTVVEEAAANVYTLPSVADFLMCYSVAEGFVSFRDPLNGTFYIQDLCETLKQQGSTLEFTELLTLVNLKVSRRSKDKKQMPCFTSMLTKKLYFRPKE